MRLNALSILLVAAVGCGGGKAPEKPEPVKVATPADVQEAAKGVVEKYRQAYEVRSKDALADLYSQTVDVVLVHQGKDSHGWAGVSAYLDDLLARAKEVHVKITMVAITAIGNSGAAISGEMIRSISDGEAAVEEKGVLTLTIRREGEKWVVVHEHFSYRPVQ